VRYPKRSASGERYQPAPPDSIPPRAALPESKIRFIRSPDITSASIDQRGNAEVDPPRAKAGFVVDELLDGLRGARSPSMRRRAPA
jgi:hypothetical protein